MADNTEYPRHRDLSLLSDEQLLAELGRRLERIRVARRIQDQEIFGKGGVKKDALAHFKKGKNISLINFIRILRGVGLLSELEHLLPQPTLFSPLSLALAKEEKLPSRIRKKQKKVRNFKWGDE
ncbi:MAG: hypothetical protein NDI61_13570 [Bdellovibrionaceae bacterium]|nr:hypothetical protein [Pseudobdellovibrionaceae bacterium]